MQAAEALAAAAELETPIAVRDDAAMERNLTRMAGLAGAAGIRLRPHAKTHKSVGVGRRQLELGACGLTVATLQEAEVFAAAGVGDLVIAHPPVGRAKLSRLAHLAERVAGAVLEAGAPRARSATVTVRKLRPPVPLDLASAGVTITRPAGA